MINFEQLKEELIPNMRGGEGTVKARRYQDGNVKIMRLCLEKGVSIGLHCHEESCEALYVLSGTANFVLDGKSERVGAGACHFCPKGSSHTVKNEDDQDLIMIAVVA